MANSDAENVIWIKEELMDADVEVLLTDNLDQPTDYLESVIIKEESENFSALPQLLSSYQFSNLLETTLQNSSSHCCSLMTEDEVLSILQGSSEDELPDSGESVYSSSSEEEYELTHLDPRHKEKTKSISSESSQVTEEDSQQPQPRPITKTRHLPDQLINWTQNRPQKDRIQYSEMPGLKVPSPGETPIDFFNLLMTERLKKFVVEQTNMYAESLKQKETVHTKTWTPLTVEEFMVWLALLFQMGTIKVNKISDYWSTDFLFNFQIFGSCMERDRFINILSCLFFAENPPCGQQSPDRLTKIQPILDIFHETMETVVRPTGHLCIDKPMVLRQGRLVLPINMNGKKNKYGIKQYLLREPSGLALKVVLDTGAIDKEVGMFDNADTVISKLMDNKLNLGHSLFTDNYYNSVQMVHYLLSQHTYVTGILKNLRNCPKNVVDAQLKKGEVARHFSEEGVCVLKWNRRLMISSEFGPDIIDFTNHQGQTKRVPEMFAKYQESMSEIDHLLMSYYPIEHQCLKWYRKLAIHIFHLIFVNSYILFKKACPNTKMSLYDFRLSVIRSILLQHAQSNMNITPSSYLLPQASTCCELVHRQQRPSSPSISLIYTKHTPRQKPKDDKGQRPRRRCVVCLLKKKRRESTYYCPACPKQPHLCIIDCFEKYHKN